MAKCLNCDKDAVYMIEKRGQKPQTFCEKDLPWAWKGAKPAEGLRRIEEVAVVTAPVVEEPKKTSTKKKSEESEVKEEVDEDREDSN